MCKKTINSLWQKQPLVVCIRHSAVEYCSIRQNFPNNIFDKMQKDPHLNVLDPLLVTCKSIETCIS